MAHVQLLLAVSLFVDFFLCFLYIPHSQPFSGLAPSFINVLNVFAFCNLHDVSWGTKGSDKADALPSVSSRKSLGADAQTVEDTTNIQASQPDPLP